MRLVTVAAFVGVLAAGPAAAEPAAEAPDYHETGLGAGETVEILPFMLDRAAVHDVTRGEGRLTVRATPGGVVRLECPDTRAEVRVTGASGSRAAFALRPGDRVSVWPVRRLEVRAEPGDLAVTIAAADWAFVIRADETSADGLGVQCDDARCNLMTGWRLAMDRRGDRAVFRVVQREWPGEVVEEKRPRAGREAEGASAGEATRAEEPAPPLPLVETGWAAWEVRPAPPVSP